MIAAEMMEVEIERQIGAGKERLIEQSDEWLLTALPPRSRSAWSSRTRPRRTEKEVAALER
jgi:hypothetical protein